MTEVNTVNARKASAEQEGIDLPEANGTTYPILVELPE